MPPLTQRLQSVLGCLASTTLLGLALPANAQTAPLIVGPESATWFSPPGNTTVKGAWLLGADKQAGPYVLRVILSQGGKMPVHTHPDTRVTTVLSGTLYVGFGDTFDEKQVKAIPTGSIYVAPANQPHYVWAKDGEVTYQETGLGPTETVTHKH
jgi:quercetin dioxygenase-like cupin family protein